MTDDAAGWLPADDGASIGDAGSEGGVILRDDEYRADARITLERGGIAPFAITCGLYGWMMHTRFFDTLAEAEREYAAMRPALAALAERVPPAGDPGLDAKMEALSAAIGRFVERFP